MITCFKCHWSFETLNLLLEHFKDEHGMSSLDYVMCTYKNCPRICTNMRYFKKHYEDVHGTNLPEGNRASVSSLFEHNSLRTAISVTNEEAGPSVSTGKELNHPILTDDFTNMNNIEASTSSIDNAASLINESQADESFNFSDTENKKALEKKVFDFCSNMYCIPSMPLSHCQMIFRTVTDLVEGINNAYKQKIMSLGEMNVEQNSQNLIPALNETFTFVESTLKSYRSCYRVEQALKRKMFFIPPITRTLGRVKKRMKFKKKFCVINVKVSRVYVPLPKVLQKLFEQKDLLRDILEYVDSLKNERQSISNVIQGSCWQNKDCRTKDGIILPLAIFNDDLELGCAFLGHAGSQKVNATYVTLPCLPPKLRGSLHNIFVTLLTKSSNLKIFPVKRIFKPVINDLNLLSTVGITALSPSGERVKIFFQLCSFIGDNLGLNTIGGFSQSFSFANYYCRICFAHRDICKYLVREVAHLLRTTKNYEEHCQLNNATETGIKGKCILNDVHGFEIVHNCALDVSHDLLEGVCQYDLCFMLKHYICSAKYFTLVQFNERLKEFNYGSADVSNKPPPLSATFHKKRTLRLSASETACLVKYFGLLVGDFVPPNDEVWQLYIALRKVLDIVMSPSVDRRTCTLLADLISQHHLLWVALTQKPLTAKFHNLIHYPSKILHFGPLIHQSSIRGDGKHRLLKGISNAVASRRDICQTIGRKCQLQQGSAFASKKHSQKPLRIGRKETGEKYEIFFRGIEDCTFTTPFPLSIKDRDTVSTTWVEVNGTRYNEGNVLYAQVDEETSIPIFGLVVKIFVTKNRNVYFLLRNYRTLSFNSHYHAYELILTSSHSVLNQEEIHDFHPHSPICNSGSLSMLENRFYVSLLTDL